MVKDGMTVVLGGLKKENKVHTRRGIPGLMDIPYIKKLFSNTAESIESTEIVIFITPHIVTGDESYNSYRGDIKPGSGYGENDGNLSESGRAQGLKLKE